MLDHVFALSHRFVCCVVFLCGGMLAAGAEVVPPTPIDTTPPTAPETPVGPTNAIIGPEGWLLVRYSVQDDGSVADVTVLDAVPPRIRSDDAVRTIQQWKFDPATRDGTAIAWHGNVALIPLFAKDWPNDAAATWFRAQFTRVQEALSNKLPGLAQAHSDLLLDQFQWRRYELALALVQRAFIEIQLNDIAEANRTIRRATHPDLNLLSPKELKTALQYRFAVSQAIGDLTDAIATVERLQAIEPLPPDHAMVRKANELRARLASAESFTTRGFIDTRPWVQELPRRKFMVTEVAGRIDDINAYCDTGKVAIAFQPNTGWGLPEDLGKCHVVVNGAADTSFKMVFGQ